MLLPSSFLLPHSPFLTDVFVFNAFFHIPATNRCRNFRSPHCLFFHLTPPEWWRERPPFEPPAVMSSSSVLPFAPGRRRPPPRWREEQWRPLGIISFFGKGQKYFFRGRFSSHFDCPIWTSPHSIHPFPSFSFYCRPFFFPGSRHNKLAGWPRALGMERICCLILALGPWFSPARTTTWSGKAKYKMSGG